RARVHRQRRILPSAGGAAGARQLGGAGRPGAVQADVPSARHRDTPHAARCPAAKSGHCAHRTLDHGRSPAVMRRLISFAIVLLGMTGVSRPAAAYPYFQLSTGAIRCNQCHFSPGGGGNLTAFGRQEAGDTISNGGNGEFLHGLWSPPSWFALGG